MIQLLRKTDLSQIEETDLHPLAAKHLRDYFTHMLARFDCEDLSRYGGILFMKTAEECTFIDAMKERLPLQYDISMRLVLHGETEHIEIVQAVYKLNNKALIVFGMPEVMEPMIQKEYAAVHTGEE